MRWNKYIFSNQVFRTIFLLIIALWSYACTESTADKLDVYLKHCYENNQFNGAVLVAKNGEIIYHKVYGIANIDPVEPLQINSQFRLASVSKQFTAMAIMILKERGKLNYEDSITKYIPELPYQDVTVRHLLTHTSGIVTYYDFFERFWDPEHDKIQDKKIATNDDVIALLVRHQFPLLSTPGEKWVYNDTGYELLASIVERAAGEPFEIFLKNNIFEPLDMSHSLVYSAIRKDPMENRVYGFRFALNGSDYIPNDFHFMSGIAGDGAIYSTTGDLYKWDRALYTENLVSKSTLNEAFTPVVLNNDSTYNYGFGWGINTSENGKMAVSHGGGWIAARTWIWREIEEDNSIILLTNHTSPYIYDIRRDIQLILHDKPYTSLQVGISDIIGRILVTESIESAISEYQRLKESINNQYKFNKWELNTLGNRLIKLEKFPEAIEIFKLNTASYPKYSSAFGGLGEAYRLNGNPDLAIENFKMALELYPDNNWAKRKLKQLTTN